MAGFFKKWAENISDYKHLQQELTVIMARSGINFMHLHPEITKFMVSLAREEGAETAVTKVNEIMYELSSQSSGVGLSQEEAKHQMVATFKTLNEIAATKP
jgi:hypothetical protein